jgi:Uma2 family endonuclease
MSVSIPSPPRIGVIYPDSDGQPMADNTLQFRWIVTIKEGLETLFMDRPDVFVAGDLLWYPVEGDPKTRIAPDALVAFGRPKGDRGSYKQWEEGGIAPQVVFEVLSPGNRPPEMQNKLRCYERFGVQEYYLYDPDHVRIFGWLREGDELREIREMNGWTSPLLGIRFVLPIAEGELEIQRPDGKRFLSYLELAQERDQFAQERDQFAQERDQFAHERDAERQRAERLAAQLRALGIEPE